MNFNLLHESWIPVVLTDGTRRAVAPWEMTLPGIGRPDWPRPDLNIACLELLIGLVAMADPPRHIDDWFDRQDPDPDRLRAALAAYEPAFNLLGAGPRFLQDFVALNGEESPPDMLFIDSAGANTARNNADLMVRRGRYPVLPLPLAAMALYTFQAFAPSGGAGNRTSMRGGGPMVTLVQPEGGRLWDTVWANVPDGTPAPAEALPWMRPCRTSEGDQKVWSEQAHPIEAFFGMPRRLRLVGDEGGITGVIQKNYGTNYAGWVHPLSPYYRQKAGAELLPQHPRAGLFGYRNWLGVVAASPDPELRQRAQVVRDWHERGERRGARVLVAGWAMDNMKPRDFTLSTPPLIPPEAGALVAGMVEAAELYGIALRAALAPVLGEGEAREAVREAFFARTQAAFEARVATGEGGKGWLADMRAVAFDLFDTRALPGLALRDVRDQRAILVARRNLIGAFDGHGPKSGAPAYSALGLIPPARKGKAA